MNKGSNNLTRVGVFYDGNYFLHVSNYYTYVHPKKKRLSVSGIHKFIREKVAELEENDSNLCRIVDSHYFRGRVGAQEAAQRGNQLYYERVFDDILMSEGVVTHYFPLKTSFGRREEKKVDVSLALEAYEKARSGRYDVVVLISSDSEFVPLIRKLNGLGIRVMLLCWDFEFTNDEGKKTVSRTSQLLLKEVSYPLQMHELIEKSLKKDQHSQLFVHDEANPSDPTSYSDYNEDDEYDVEEDKFNRIETNQEIHTSEVMSIKNGFGFIKYPNNNLFFHYTDVLNVDFNELMVGDQVEFTVETKYNGQDVAKNVKKVNL
jgi:uncharacterized LabA/DUF88 family protein/cold shock CspA family protein